MADLEATETRLSFDDILEAVQDSKRGRWFLQEFETRLQKRDTASLLSAMQRLENRMGELSKTSGKPEDLGPVTAAIATARNDLLKLGLGREAMSTEGRLFADLAEMARKAMPSATEGREGIVRALQLVDEIDTAISPPPSADRGAKYFQPDAALFERKHAVAKAVLAAVPAATELPKETPAAGAKLVIRKTVAAPEQPPAPEATAPTEPPVDQHVAADPAPESVHIDNPRIVIIRRKAEDMPEVSMGETDTAA